VDFKKTQLNKYSETALRPLSASNTEDSLIYNLPTEFGTAIRCPPLAVKYGPVKALSVPINGTSGKIFDVGAVSRWLNEKGKNHRTPS
jgi:hypothetical protein